MGLEPVDVPAARRDAPERRVAVRLDVGLDERPAEHERHGRAGPLERDEAQDIAVDVDEQPGTLAHVEQQLEIGLAGLDDAGLRRPIGAGVDAQTRRAREIARQARRADVEVDPRPAVLAQAMEPVVGADADDAAAVGLVRPLDRGDLTVEQRLVLLGHPEPERGARRTGRGDVRVGRRVDEGELALAGRREDLADDDLGQAGGLEHAELAPGDLDDDARRSEHGEHHASARTADAGGMRRIRGGGIWSGSAMPL